MLDTCEHVIDIAGIAEAELPASSAMQVIAAGREPLRAMLDWSYELLAEPERAILRRLAIFAGAFSLEAASAVAASAELAPGGPGLI